LLYDAKILEVRLKDPSDKKSPHEYLVHYKGWKNTYVLCFIISTLVALRTLHCRRVFGPVPWCCCVSFLPHFHHSHSHSHSAVHQPPQYCYQSSCTSLYTTAMADRVQLRWVNKPNRRHLSGIPPTLTSLPMLYTLEVLCFHLTGSATCQTFSGTG
jgi:hypothetical protein